MRNEMNQIMASLFQWVLFENYFLEVLPPPPSYEHKHKVIRFATSVWLIINMSKDWRITCYRQEPTLPYLLLECLVCTFPPLFVFLFLDIIVTVDISSLTSTCTVRISIGKKDVSTNIHVPIIITPKNSSKVFTIQ